MLIAGGVLMYLADKPGGKAARPIVDQSAGCSPSARRRRWPSCRELRAAALRSRPGCFAISTANRPHGFPSCFPPRPSAPRRPRPCTTLQKGGLHAVLNTGFSGGRGRQRDYRLPGHRLVPEIFAPRRTSAICVLSHYFWHNSACSGFHPPASVMKLLSPTQHKRLNEVIGFLLLSLGLVLLLSLVSYHDQDPSFATAGEVRPFLNLVGYRGAYRRPVVPDLRPGAFSSPSDLSAGWRWIRSGSGAGRRVKLLGCVLLTLAPWCLSRAAAPLPWRRSRGVRSVCRWPPPAVDSERHRRVGPPSPPWCLGLPGLDVYPGHPGRSGWRALGPGSPPAAAMARWRGARASAGHREGEGEGPVCAARRRMPRSRAEGKNSERTQKPAPLPSDVDGRPWESPEHPQPAEYASVEELAAARILHHRRDSHLSGGKAPVPDLFPAFVPASGCASSPPTSTRSSACRPPICSTTPPARNPYDEQELQETASRIKAKFEEFNVLGNGGADQSRPRGHHL